MQLLIQWPYSLYDEGYCAVIVSHDGDVATLLEVALYHAAWHGDSGLQRLVGPNGGLPKSPAPAVMKYDVASCPECHKPKAGAPSQLFTLDDFALYKDGVELPRTGTLTEAGIADRDWLTLDYVVRDRFGKRKPASETSVERATFDGPCEPAAMSEDALNRLLSGNRQAVYPLIDEPMASAIRALIREEIVAHERKQFERVKYRRHSGEASSNGPREYPFPFD